MAYNLGQNVPAAGIGIVSGAASGAAAGSIVPGIGNAIGAGVGAGVSILGSIAKLFGGSCTNRPVTCHDICTGQYVGQTAGCEPNCWRVIPNSTTEWDFSDPNQFRVVLNEGKSRMSQCALNMLANNIPPPTLSGPTVYQGGIPPDRGGIPVSQSGAQTGAIASAGLFPGGGVIAQPSILSGFGADPTKTILMGGGLIFGIILLTTAMRK